MNYNDRLRRYCADIRVGDLSVQVLAERNFRLYEIFHPASTLSEYTCTIRELPILGDMNYPPQIEGNCITLITERGSPFPVVDFLRSIAYFVILKSPTFRLCHAAGLQMNEKGILIMGPSHSGKSTLCSLLPGSIVDDDLVFATPTHFTRVTRFGFQRRAGKNEVEVIGNDYRQLPLHTVFVLDRSQEPTYVEEIDSQTIDPALMFDDQLHPSLFSNYQKRMPIPFEARAYRIGTSHSPKRTRDLILSYF